MSKSRGEELLETLVNGEDSDIKPQSRMEEYLLAAIKKYGTDGLPKPISRGDALLHQLVDVVSNSSGGGEEPDVETKGVNFYDYDGTLLHTYTVAEAQELTELPELPTQEGLICQCWNWTLEDIKAQNSELDVGAVYITDDGKTRIYIKVDEPINPIICMNLERGTAVIDWGDGTDTETLEQGYTRKSNRHEYSPGNYTITITLLDNSTFSIKESYIYGCLFCYDDVNDCRNYRIFNSIQKIEFGRGLRSINRYSLRYLECLKTITIPKDVEYLQNGDNLFSGCESLKSIVIPNGAKTLNGWFNSCKSLKICSIPKSVTTLNNTWKDCTSLERITLSNNVTTYQATGILNGCSSLKRVILSNADISGMSYIFKNCSSLEEIILPDGSTAVPTGTFSGCTSLKNISLPNSISKIDSNGFEYCHSLKCIELPDSITSIGIYAFYSCKKLYKIKMPSNITSINSIAFRNCQYLSFVDFSNSTSVPSLASINAFEEIPPDFEILVPASLYEEWIAATNWSTIADNIKAKENS